MIFSGSSKEREQRTKDGDKIKLRKFLTRTNERRHARNYNPRFAFAPAAYILAILLSSIAFDIVVPKTLLRQNDGVFKIFEIRCCLQGLSKECVLHQNDGFRAKKFSDGTNSGDPVVIGVTNDSAGNAPNSYWLRKISRTTFARDLDGPIKICRMRISDG